MIICSHTRVPIQRSCWWDSCQANWEPFAALVPSACSSHWRDTTRCVVFKLLEWIVACCRSHAVCQGQEERRKVRQEFEDSAIGAFAPSVALWGIDIEMHFISIILRCTDKRDCLDFGHCARREVSQRINVCRKGKRSKGRIWGTYHAVAASSW